jgi:suppressor of ftsI
MQQIWFDFPVKAGTFIHMQFTNYPGKTVFHCHILNHEGAGMMAAVLKIVEE